MKALISEISTNSKVWTFIPERKLTNNEQELLEDTLTIFIEGWTAHKSDLKASFVIIDNNALIITVDESKTGASGCSIDKLHNFIKDYEIKNGVKMLDRMRILLKSNEMQWENISANEFKELAQKGLVDANTIVFNSLINYFGQPYEIRAGETWLNKFFTK